MVVELLPEIEKFVEEKVRAGEFASAEEAVNQLLSGIRAQNVAGDDELAELRELVDQGLSELDRGETVDFTAQEIIAERRKAYPICQHHPASV